MECAFTKMPPALKSTFKTELGGGGRQKTSKCKKVKVESDSTHCTQSTTGTSHCNKPLANVTNTVLTRNCNKTTSPPHSDMSAQAQILKCLGIDIAKGSTSTHDSATQFLQSLQSHLTTILHNTAPQSRSKTTTPISQTKQVPTGLHTRTPQSVQEPNSQTRNRNTQSRKSKTVLKKNRVFSKTTSEISPRLIQASLGTGLNTNTVQVVPHKSACIINKKQAKRKSRLSPAKSRLKRQSPNTIVSPSIEDYFKRSSSTSPRDCEENSGGTSCREQLMTGAASVGE